MSDFLYTAISRRAGELGAVLRRFPGLPRAELTEWSGSWGSLATKLAEHEQDACVVERGHITLVLGSPVVRLSGPPAAVTVGTRGAKLHAALAVPDFAPGDILDGAFLALRLDPASGELRVYPDRFGFIPLFHARDRQGGVVLGSHPDAVAEAAGSPGLDPVSAADLAANLSCTFPFTAWRGVEQLEPGSAYLWLRGEARPPRSWWQPRETRAFARLEDAAAALRGAVQDAVRASCTGQERVAVLLSGGEGSRAVLAALPPGTPAAAVSYTEPDSREGRIARAAAAAYGAELQQRALPPDRYASSFDKTVALLGSQHLFVDEHGLGLHASLTLDTFPVVLGGLSADALLKAPFASATGRGGFRSPRLPGLREELLHEVDARREAHRQRLLALRPDSADEWLHLWPFSMRPDGGSLGRNRRLFRSHEIFHAHAVLDVAAAAPAAWKRHRRLFHRALQPLFAASRLLPDAADRFPYYGLLGNLLLVPRFAVAGAPGLQKGDVQVRRRPPIAWEHLLQHEAMRARVTALLPASELVRALLAPGAEPAATVAQWPALRGLMLLQLAAVGARGAARSS